MGADPFTASKRQRFDELMRAGLEAYRRDERRLAHDYWREAATLDPYSEKVWLALYRVLEADEDRRVCLQNIIAINPTNAPARRRLNALSQRAEQGASAPARDRSEKRGRQSRARRSPLIRAIIIGAIAGVAGVLGGILASILIYGR